MYCQLASKKNMNRPSSGAHVTRGCDSLWLRPPGWSARMTQKVETITCNFVGDFKVGDNLLRNAGALCRLKEKNDKGVFNKLIVVQAGSILEAALDQIIYRAQNYTKEGVPNISDADLKKIRGSKIERFNNIIQAANTYKMLDALGTGIYDDLHKFRQYRNRVHIQFDDEPQGGARDDDKAFSDQIVTWSLTLCVQVLKELRDRFPRPKELEVFAMISRFLANDRHGGN
jgi:hypothetical protein